MHIVSVINYKGGVGKTSLTRLISPGSWLIVGKRSSLWIWMRKLALPFR